MKALSPLPLACAAVFFAAITSGCRCGPGNINNAAAELAATPTALQFNACPTKDEQGRTVADVFPDTQTVTISNLGKVTGEISSIEITGDDPEIQKIFSIPADKKPTAVEGSGSVDIPVLFSPTTKGDISGKLTITSSGADAKPVTVSLVGNGINVPSQPTVALDFETAPGSGVFTACDPSLIISCAPTWPTTFFNETSTLSFRVKNAGCPTLKITGAELKPNPQQTATQQAYSFESGFIPPTPGTPAELSVADDNSSLLFNIKFSPVEEGTPQNPDDGQRYAILTLTTNDPLYPTLDIGLSGFATKPSAYASPTFCNFTDPSDTCGNTSKIANKARVTIGNGGGANIKVASLTFAHASQTSTRFALTGPSAVGQVIPVGGSISQEVTYTDQPVFIADDLIISTTDAVNTNTPAGDVRVTFYGGTLPCMTTDPADTLSFENPTDKITTRDVTIKNGAGCGTLIIDDVVVDQPNAFFAISAKPPPGTPVAGGSQVTTTVQFTQPVSGGTQTGVARIKTNDPVYGPDPYKVITLYSNAPLDQLPIAVLQGCAPGAATCTQQLSMSVSKAAIQPVNGKKIIGVSGAGSYDPQPNGTNVPATQYQFLLTAKPSNATASAVSLENNGVKTTQSTAGLTIDPAVTGEYRVALRVYDSAGQPSANLDTLKIIVNP